MERSADAPSTDHWVDKTSRVLFPALFVLFLMIYTVHYKSRIEAVSYTHLTLPTKLEV